MSGLHIQWLQLLWGYFEPVCNCVLFFILNSLRCILYLICFHCIYMKWRILLPFYQLISPNKLLILNKMYTSYWIFCHLSGFPFCCFLPTYSVVYLIQQCIHVFCPDPRYEVNSKINAWSIEDLADMSKEDTWEDKCSFW